MDKALDMAYFVRIGIHSEIKKAIDMLNDNSNKISRITINNYTLRNVGDKIYVESDKCKNLHYLCDLPSKKNNEYCEGYGMIGKYYNYQGRKMEYDLYV